MCGCLAVLVFMFLSVPRPHRPEAGRSTPGLACLSRGAPPRRGWGVLGALDTWGKPAREGGRGAAVCSLCTINP